jgi:hypothetical protein
MIELAPHLAFEAECPACGARLVPRRVLWQGIHVCAESLCQGCQHTIVSDLPVAHGIYYPFHADLTASRLFGGEEARQWFGEPLLASLLKPAAGDVPFRVERFSSPKQVVILNCLDYLYGHALLKLMNAERHLAAGPGVGVVVIVPELLRWMVPAGVSEIWTVGLTLAESRRFHPTLHDRIEAEAGRFDRRFLSKAHTHPMIRDIALFTGQRPHDFSAREPRVTFIWREDRLWLGTAARIGTKLPGMIVRQRQKVVRFMSALRHRYPGAKFTLAGLGMATTFPGWIEDLRVKRFSPEAERALCQVYAESRVVIGIHGSHMLLPSAHAGMTVDLMPRDRWGNFAQDVVFLEPDVRLGAFRYRMLPQAIPADELAEIVARQLADHEQYVRVMKG